MVPLTDRQRIELALPAMLFWGLAACDCFGPDPNAPDQAEAEREVIVKKQQLRDLLSTACHEPVEDLPPKKLAQMARRIDRLATYCADDFQQQPAVKVAMALYYFLEDLLQRDCLVLWEGSAMGTAVEMLMPMFAHGFERERQDASAQKQARRMLEKLQREGFYR